MHRTGEPNVDGGRATLLVQRFDPLAGWLFHARHRPVVRNGRAIAVVAASCVFGPVDDPIGPRADVGHQAAVPDLYPARQPGGDLPVVGEAEEHLVDEPAHGAAARLEYCLPRCCPSAQPFPVYRVSFRC